MTSLAQQLQRLAVPHTQTIFAEDKRRKSLLFDPKEAAELDKETFYSLGINGLEELQSLDASFQEFESTLFAESSITFERSVQTKEINETLDRNIQEFLIKLMPYCLLKPAQKALEWLVYRYHIHQYNIDDLVLCMLPYHESKIFARTVQLLTLDSKTATKWDWLLPLQKSGVHLPRLTLINHCRTNTGFLSFVCDVVPRAVKVHRLQSDQGQKLRTLLAFYVSTVIGVLETGGVSESLVATLLPHISVGLRSKVNDYKASTYMILAELFYKIKLKSDVLKTLLNVICKRISSSLIREAVSCILLMFQTQDVHSLTKRSFKYISRQPGFVQHLCSLAADFKSENLIKAVFEQLIPAAFSQSLEQASSGESSESESSGIQVNHLLMLQELLGEIQLQNPLADAIIRDILISYVQYGHNAQDVDLLSEMGQQVRDMVRLLEARYSESVDKAVTSVLNDPEFSDMKSLVQDFLNLSVLSVQHQNMPDSNASLTLSLNHRTPEVRLSAVKFLLQNTDKESEAEFMSNAILARLQDDSPEVVQAVLHHAGKNIWTMVQDHKALMNCLVSILTWRTSVANEAVSQNTVEVLFAADPSMDEGVLLATLPFLVLQKGMSSDILHTFISSDFATRNPVFQPLIKKFQSRFSPQSPIKRAARKKAKSTEEENDPAKVNVELIEALVDGIGKLDESESSRLMGSLVERYAVSAAKEDRYFLLLLLNRMVARETDEDMKYKYCVEHLRALRATCPSPDYHTSDTGRYLRDSPWNFEQCVAEMYEWLHTDDKKVHKMGVSLLAEFISTMDLPQALTKGKTFWEYRNDSSTEDKCLYVLVQAFDLLTLMSNHGGEFCNLVRMVTSQFMQKLSRQDCMVQFLGFLWTLHTNPHRDAVNFNLAMQAKALKVGQVYLMSWKHDNLDHQQFTRVFTNLLITMTTSSPPIRQCALQVLESLQPVAKETDSVFLVLVNKIVRCRAELTADNEYLLLLMRSLFKSLQEDEMEAPPTKKRLRKSSKQSRKQQFLDVLIDLIVNTDTPTYIQHSLLSVMKLVTSQSVFESLLPLLEFLLSHFTSETCTAVEFSTCCLLLEHFTADTVSLLTLDGKPLALLVKAMTCCTTCVETRKSIQQVAIQQITRELYSGLQPDIQQTVLSCLFDVWVNAEGSKLPIQIKRVIKHLSLDGSHIVSELQSSLKVTHVSTIRDTRKSKRRSKASSEKEGEDEFEGKSWQRITTVLEAIQDKKKITNYTLILPAVFKILSRILESEFHPSAEYIKQLLLSVIYTTCDKAIATGNAIEMIPEQGFNLELIVNCIRTSDNPQTHHHALLVLTWAAKLYPEKLLHNIMSVFTFMGTNMLRHDDAYSFHIINRILETVVPALVTACEQRKRVPKGVSGNPEDVITMVIRVFVDAYPHIPEHRRLMLFTKLIQIVGQGSYLWRCVLLMIEHFVSKAGQVSEGDSDKKEDHENYFEFVLNLCHQFTIEEQLTSASEIILYTAKLPDDRDEAVSRVTKPMPTSLGKLKKEDTEIFNVKFHTAKQLRHFRYESMQFLVAMFTSSDFIAQLSENLAEGVVPAFQGVLQRVMEYIPQLTKTSESHTDQPTARFWRVLLNKVYELLDKVVVLLPDNMFIDVVSSLMDHSTANIQRKAMELLNNNLLQLKEHSASKQLGYLLPLVDKLISVVEKTSLGKDNSEENIVNGQTALYSLKLLCRLLGFDYPHNFIKVMKLSVEIFSSRGDNLAISASALLCIAEICNSLKAHVIVHLASFMPQLIKVLKEQDKLFMNDLYLLSVITTILKVVENLSLFLSPYLNDIVHQLCLLSGDSRESLQKPQLQQRMKAIRHTLATVLPPRILLPVVTWCYENISVEHITSLTPMMSVLEEHIASMQKEDLNSHIQQLQGLFLKCMDLRSQYRKQIPTSQLSEIEDSILSTFVAMVMKLSEATFRPILFKLFDWATRDEGTKYRVLTFYRLANRLSEKLRSLFTIFAGHIIQHAAQTLDKYNISKTERTPFGKARNLTNQLLQYILECLYHCFLYDTEGFVTKERFGTLMQPLVDQLENLDKPKLYHSRVTDHMVPCIVQFAVAAQDDALWKSMNYQILLKTRHNSAKVRFAALAAIEEFHRKFGEDYMPLLPETIPFLAELMEDENEEVERKSHSVIAEMEKTLGEPLQKYF